MGLGALNKAEWINGGGEEVLKALQPLNLRWHETYVVLV